MTAHRTTSRHPNRTPFEGVLARVDAPSDGAPNGSRGHRVVLTREAAQEGLGTLIGMAVGFAADWGKHNRRQKCGVITHAWIDGDEICVTGYVFSHDFPDVDTEMRRPGAELGMSYEIIDAHVEDMRADPWRLTRVTFTGAAILLRSRAAYKDTSINLEATLASPNFVGRLSFTSVGSLQLSPQPRPGLLERVLQCFKTGL